MPFLLGLGGALWFGVLTSMSPCPLAANITAISYMSRRAGHPKFVLLSGLLYSLGRMAAYIVIGVLVISGTLAIPGVAWGLQKYMNALLGPFLLLAGIFALGVVPFPTGSGRFLANIQAKADQWGIAGAFVLGFIFALSFCPVSAGIFFGSVIPMAIAQGSRFFFPAVYGLGTALPVVFFAVVVAFSAQSIGSVFRITTQIEKWARWGSAAIFIMVGLYFTLAHTLKVF